jgi:hypothetical protein
VLFLEVQRALSGSTTFRFAAEHLHCMANIHHPECQTEPHQTTCTSNRDFMLRATQSLRHVRRDNPYARKDHKDMCHTEDWRGSPAGCDSIPLTYEEVRLTLACV